MFILKHKGQWSVKAMCQTLNVSETGYYKFKRNLDKPSKDAILSASIKEILGESPYNDNYGVPRMQLALNQRGIKAGKRRIIRIMRENGGFISLIADLKVWLMLLQRFRRKKT